MRTDKSNTSANHLPAGISEQALVEAIAYSGYPLQGVIARALLPEFDVLEEWGYIDRDTQEHRALDIFAYKALTDTFRQNVQPRLVLLVECKRSRHPYVFFKAATERWVPNFPRLAGIPRGYVPISDPASRRSQDADPAKVLGIDELEFIRPGPPRCAAFSKAQPSGKKVEMSGTDPFQNLILPLTKATSHAAGLFGPGERPERIQPTLILSISVLDAPLILVDEPGSSIDPMLTPWVRVVRQEANPNRKTSEPWYRHYVVDVVHASYFNEFIAQHLMPFAREFSDRAIKQGPILLTRGIVDNLDNWTWDQVRLNP